MATEIKHEIPAGDRARPLHRHRRLFQAITCIRSTDLIVDDAVIADPKAVACFTDTHVAQMVGYLNITGLDLALLLNFKNARLEWKRVLRPREPGEHDTPDLHA